MYLKYSHNIQRSFKNRKPANGSALVLAIFILIIMTLLGTALVKIISTSAEAIAYEVLGTRALQSANIGVEWQLQQIFPLDSAAVDCPSQSTIDLNKPNVANIEGLFQCQIATLSCISNSVIYNGVTTTYYTITSTGECDINGDVTSRTLQISAKSL